MSHLLDRVQSIFLLFLAFAAVGLAAEDTCGNSSQLTSDQCRLVPTWTSKNISPETCANVTGYQPDHDHLFETATPEYRENEDWFATMASCINDATNLRCKQDSDACAAANDKPLEEPEITGLYPSPENAVMATVEFALTESEAALVQDLTSCLRRFHPNQFEHRKFETEENDGGGNDATFLAGFLQIFAPGVAHQVYNIARLVWDTAGWKDVEYDGYGNEVYYPDPRQTGIRTSEHLSYEKWGSLVEHEDNESLYTVLVSLADPSEYEGGAYFLRPKSMRDNEFEISLKPNRLSAIVFISEENHGVHEILSGKREMFTNELWAYGDVTFGHRRPSKKIYREIMEWPDEEEEDEEDYREDWEDSEDWEGSEGLEEDAE